MDEKKNQPEPKPVEPRPATAQTAQEQPKAVDPKADASPRSVKFSLDSLAIRGEERETKNGG